MSSKAKGWTFFLVILTIIVLLTSIGAWFHGKEKGWWAERSEVVHLRTHPLMAPEIDGYPQVRVEHTEPVGFMGKASNPYYFGWYDNRSSSSDQLRDLIVGYATDHGFALDEALSTSEVAVFHSTQIGEENLHLSIEIAGPLSMPDAGTQFHGCILVKLYYL